MTERLLHQRLRNQQLDFLEWVRSAAAHMDYQRKAPVNVINEVFNQWEDAAGPELKEFASKPVYTPEEIEALTTFHDVWDALADLPEGLRELLCHPPYLEFMAVADRTYRVLAKRGRLPAEHEIGWH